jgi:hypothetical protein
MPFFMMYKAEAVLPQRSPWALSVSRHTTKLRKTSPIVKISAWSMSEDDNMLLKMLGTGRRFGITMNGSCATESSKWMIWCSDGSLAGKVPTNSPQARRVISE